MAVLNLADRPWCMCSHMLCNYMPNWCFPHSISALASGTGAYTCARGMQGPMSASSFQLPHFCPLILLRTGSLILCGSSYPPSLPTFTEALFLLPALQNYCQVVGMCSWPISIYSCQICLFLISSTCYSQFRLYSMHYKCVHIWKSTSFSKEIFPMRIIYLWFPACEHQKK